MTRPRKSEEHGHSVLNYVAEPTPALFHLSDAFFRSLAGPIGSSKTVACVYEWFVRACAQLPDKFGQRRTRILVVRNTYDQLRKTTLDTFDEWLPQKLFKIKYSAPFSGKLDFRLQNDGTRVMSEVLFMSLDKLADLRKLKSLHLTMAFVNEMSEIRHKVIIDTIMSRLGRYPSKDDGGPSWVGLFGDTNMPDDDHWLYRYAELGTWRTESSLLGIDGRVNEDELREQLALALGKEGEDEKSVQKVLDGMRETTLIGDPKHLQQWEFFKQPAALLRRTDGKGYIPNPAAENVQNQPLGFNYWMNQVAGKDREWIKVFLLAEYGSLFTGRPVYDGVWSSARHVSKEPLEVIPGLPLFLGTDWATHPFCVVGQLLPNGQLRLLREWFMDRAGAKQFLEEMVIPGLRIEFPGMRVAGGWGDISGGFGNQVDITLSCFKIAQDLGLNILPVGNNRFEPRRESVLNRLRRNVGGDQPALLVSPRCPVIIKAHNGAYQFNRVRNLGEGGNIYKDMPDKDAHPYSDGGDAVQYLSQGLDLVSVQEEHRKKMRERIAPVDGARVWRAFT